MKQLVTACQTDFRSIDRVLEEANCHISAGHPELAEACIRNLRAFVGQFFDKDIRPDELDDEEDAE